MYPNNGSTAKGSECSRQPLKHLPKTYANLMSLPSGNRSPYYPILPINTSEMDNLAPFSSVATSLHANSRTPPPADFTGSPFGSVLPGADFSSHTREQTYQQVVGQKRIKSEHGYLAFPSGIDVTFNDSQGETALTFENSSVSMYDGSMAGVLAGAIIKDDMKSECLALPEDRRHLTELHCFVRKHNVYLFCAGADDAGGKIL